MILVIKSIAFCVNEIMMKCTMYIISMLSANINFHIPKFHKVHFGTHDMVDVYFNQRTVRLLIKISFFAGFPFFGNILMFIESILKKGKLAISSET